MNDFNPVGFEEVDFSQEILRDLIKQGYSGEEPIEEFGRIKANIPKALDALKQEAMEQPTITGNLDDYLDLLEENQEDEWPATL